VVRYGGLLRLFGLCYAMPDGNRFNADYALQTEDAQRMLIHGYCAAVSYTDCPSWLPAQPIEKVGIG